MHRWSILLFLSFFSYFLHFPLFFILISSPLVSTSLFLLSFSSVFFSQLSHLTVFSPLCRIISYSLLFVFDLIFFSSVLVIASCFHLSSPLFSLSHLLSLSTFSSFFPLPSSHHFSPCFILLSPIFSISPHLSFLLSPLTLILCSSSALLVSSLPLSSCSHLLSSLLPSFSHLISSHVSLQFSPLILILCYAVFSLLLFTASKISSTIPKRSVSLIRSQSSFCSSSPFYSSVNLLHIVFYLNQPLISDE